jgi:hypothetical protein
MSKYTDRLSERAKILSAELAKTLKRLDDMAVRTPKEPEYEARTAEYVTFVKYFTGTTPYRYVAVRPENRHSWSVSGKRGHERFTWILLMDFVLDQETNAERAIASVSRLGEFPRDARFSERQDAERERHDAFLITHDQHPEF